MKCDKVKQLEMIKMCAFQEENWHETVVWMCPNKRKLGGAYPCGYSWQYIHNDTMCWISIHACLHVSMLYVYKCVRLSTYIGYFILPSLDSPFLLSSTVVAKKHA